MKQMDDFQICEVRWGRHQTIGLLYMQTNRVVVLLNSVGDLADLGPLKPIRKEHAVPEATIMVIPSNQVSQIDTLGVSKQLW